MKKELALNKMKGFTLIELIITMTIIVLMVLVAVPSFSKYEENASFNAKVTEIESAINQAIVSSQNPEQNITYYVVRTDPIAKTVSIYKGSTLVKTISMPSAVSTVALYDSDKPILIFNTGKSFVCIRAFIVLVPACDIPFSGNYIIITGTNDRTKTISVSSNPVRVTSQ